MPNVVPLTDEPRDLLLGPDNDLVVNGGDLTLVIGVDAVAQSCRIATQMFTGEWFADLDAGVPYWQQILGFKPRAAVAAARVVLRRTLLAVKGVVDVAKLDVQFDRATRALTAKWSVTTAAGDTPATTLPFGGS